MKNKQVVKYNGRRWFLKKNGKAEPTDWRLQAVLAVVEANRNGKTTKK